MGGVARVEMADMSTGRHLESVMKESGLDSRAGFLSFGSTDTWGWVILCHGVGRRLSSTLGGLAVCLAYAHKMSDAAPQARQ